MLSNQHSDRTRAHSPLRPGVLPTAPYSTRPPSPPYIHVPAVPFPAATSTTTTTGNLSTSSNPSDANTRARTPSPFSNILMTITPSPNAVHYSQYTPTPLSHADLALVTRNLAPQYAKDASTNWVYESRRQAQQVLDWVYLGPASVVRDKVFMEREGITMVLAARDKRFAAVSLPGLKRALEGTGVEVEGVEVGDARELVRVFDVVVGIINRHMLRIERERVENEGQGKPGKVLVCCETGNDRSAAIVAAYLMAMFALDTVQAVQYMLLKRFCVTLGDETKHMLQAYGDILRARGDVGVMMSTSTTAPAMPAVTNVSAQGQQSHQQPLQPPQQYLQPHPTKRRIEETRDVEMDDGIDPDDVMSDAMDEERYAGRSFAPFVEREP